MWTHCNWVFSLIKNVKGLNWSHNHCTSLILGAQDQFYQKLVSTELKCLNPPPWSAIQFHKFCRKFKRNISFSIQGRRPANCVIYKAICSEQSHQFSRADKYENFLLQKYEFPSDKLSGLLCREIAFTQLTFWYFTELKVNCNNEGIRNWLKQ